MVTTLDPEKRITAKDALEHEYFKEIVRCDEWVSLTTRQLTFTWLVA